MYKKLGIIKPIEKDRLLVDSLLKLMNSHKADYNNTFSALTLNTVSDDSIFKEDEFKKWRKLWENRINHSNDNIKNFKLMKMKNPLVTPRNYLVELALENAINGNFNKFNDLLELLSMPYNYTSNFNFQVTPVGFDDSYKTFCGT